MRDWILLAEKWAMTLPKTIAGGSAEVFRNPSKTEMGRLMHDWNDNVCRAAMAQNGDLYVWHTDAAFHEEVQEAGADIMPVSLFCHWPRREVEWSELNYMQDEEGNYDEEVAQYAAVMLNSPALKRLYGTFDLWGEDDEGEYSVGITPQWIAGLK